MKSGTDPPETHRVVDVRDQAGPDPAWGTVATHVQRWPALAAVAAAILLYYFLPDKLYYGPKFLLPAVEGAMIVPLVVSRQRSRNEEEPWQRWTALAVVAVINAANIGSLALLIHALIGSNMFAGHKITAHDLIFWSAQIWLTNVIVFALWYWELDRGGPGARCRVRHREPDFLFPQMANPDAAPRYWEPSFVDYLYVSFTNATAFSPTDTMPMTEWAKLLMMLQATTSLLTVALVAARAVNILGS
ncbi:MAG: DUF1345 domain-containing protein [Chloroflexi bacterium]|nr:DUF1345 domain-containing protein [Chloroflexota bacterium]